MELILNILYAFLIILLMLMAIIMHKIGTIRKWEIEAEKDLKKGEGKWQHANYTSERGAGKWGSANFISEQE